MALDYKPAIPVLIALLESDPSGRETRRIRRYELRRLTGVEPKPDHDAAWWRTWWTQHRDQWPSQRPLEIPRLSPQAR